MVRATKLGATGARIASKPKAHANEPDWIEVAHWYRLAADAGHPAAMASLAQLYESGRGVPLDRAAALTLYRQALTAGDSNAAAAVGAGLEGTLRTSQYAR